MFPLNTKKNQTDRRDDKDLRTYKKFNSLFGKVSNVQKVSYYVFLRKAPSLQTQTQTTNRTRANKIQIAQLNCRTKKIFVLHLPWPL